MGSISVTVSLIFVITASYLVSGEFSKASLHPNCLKIEPTSHLSAEWGMKLFGGANFYMPFGSVPAIRHFSKLIASGSKNMTAIDRSGRELTGLCAQVRIRGFRMQMDGHDGNFMIQDCAVIKKGTNDCKVNGQSENPEYQKSGDAIVSIVWTDNETSMGVVRCTNDGLFNDWYVLSSQPSLNVTMKESVLATMTKLGFSNNSVSPSYDGCELFTEEDDN